MQPRVTVVLAIVWLTVANAAGAVTLRPLRLSHDQYFPIYPRQHGAQRDQTHSKDREQADDQPLWIGSQASILAEDSSVPSHKPEFVERDLSLEDIALSKQTLPLSGWQSQLSNIAEPKFTAEKVDYGETPKIFSRKVNSTNLTDSVGDDVFQDQGPGSMEIYKLDLSKEKSLLTATVPSSKLPLKNKSKVPKKTNRLDTKTKMAEIKSTTNSPEIDYEQSNSFKEQRTEVPVNRDAFGVGGVPELQVGCEGLEDSSHKTKRSIDTTSDKKREIPVTWLDVLPISLDFNYDLSYDEEEYEGMDELLKLKRLETTTRTIKPHRGDIDPTLNNDHLDVFKRPEKLPIRGDLGESILAKSRLVNSSFSTNQNESQKLINSKVNYEEAKVKWKSISTDANDSTSSHGRRLLWLAEVNTQDSVNKTRAKRSSDWGFGEDEGVVSSDELKTVTEWRRQNDMRFHQDAAKHNQQTHQMSYNDIRQQYQRLLEQRKRQEEERLRQTKQNSQDSQDSQGILNKWLEEEERRREEMQRRHYEEYHKKTSTPRRYDEEVEQRQIEDRQMQEAMSVKNDQHFEKERRIRLQEEEARRRAQEIARRNEQDEEERRRRLYKEEEMRLSHNRMREEKNARRLSHSRPVINEEDRQRSHDNEMKRREEEWRRQENARRQYEEEQRRRLQNEETRRQEEYKLQQEAQRRKEEEQRKQTDPANTLSTDDRRKLEERRREWSAKRRQEEENERQRQTLRRNEAPSNLIRMENRVTSNDSKQRDIDQDRHIREQQERERDQKLREYIARNRPININQLNRRSQEENRPYRAEDNRDSRVNESREDEEYRRRMQEQHKRQEEERKLQDYIRRNQPVTVSPRNDQSIGRNSFEERRLIEEARRRGRYPDQITIRRHGPSVSTNIDHQSSLQEVRRRQEARERQQRERERQEKERERQQKERERQQIERERQQIERERQEAQESQERERERQQIERERQEAQERQQRERERQQIERERQEAQERQQRERERQQRERERYEEERSKLTNSVLSRRKEDEKRLLRERQEEEIRRKKEEQRARSRAYEENRQRLLDVPRVEAERIRQNKQAKDQTEKFMYPEVTDCFFRDFHDDNQMRIEYERRKQEYLKLEARKQQEEENRLREIKQKKSQANSEQTNQRKQQEYARQTTETSVNTWIIPDKKDVQPSILMSRGGFENEIDFMGMNPHRQGLRPVQFPAPRTTRPPVKTPKPCIWAIVQCCTPNNRRFAECFQSAGCYGAIWDADPCRTEFLKAARMEILNFYKNA